VPAHTQRMWMCAWEGQGKVQGLGLEYAWEINSPVAPGFVWGLKGAGGWVGGRRARGAGLGEPWRR
jgi:hypothetical protein